MRLQKIKSVDRVQTPQWYSREMNFRNPCVHWCGILPVLFGKKPCRQNTYWWIKQAHIKAGNNQPFCYAARVLSFPSLLLASRREEVKAVHSFIWSLSSSPNNLVPLTLMPWTNRYFLLVPGGCRGQGKWPQLPSLTSCLMPSVVLQESQSLRLLNPLAS